MTLTRAQKNAKVGTDGGQDDLEDQKRHGRLAGSV